MVTLKPTQRHREQINVRKEKKNCPRNHSKARVEYDGDDGATLILTFLFYFIFFKKRNNKKNNKKPHRATKGPTVTYQS